MNMLEELYLLLEQAKKKERDLSRERIYPKVMEWNRWCQEKQKLPEIELEGYAVLSSLCYMKTQHLLPPLPEIMQEKEEEELESRTDLELLNEIYASLEKAKSFLQEKHKEMEPLFTRTGALILDEEIYDVEERLQPVSFSELLAQLKEFLKSKTWPDVLLPSPLPTLEEKMEEIWHKLSTTEEGISFLSLFVQAMYRANIILGFLAVLELMRLRKIRAYQEAPGKEIFLYPVKEVA